MKIAVTGLGYVGLSNAIVLARNNEVAAVDISRAKVDLVNAGKSPIVDEECSQFLSGGSLNLAATVVPEEAYRGASFVIIATPTDYDQRTGSFDTSTVERVVSQVHAVNPEAAIVIKSTVPIGFTRHLVHKTGMDNILFSPEFLREGRAVYDNLHPSRIVVGDRGERGSVFANLLAQGAEDPDVPILLTESSEAEAIKLFANSYLAMRVAFFNELDSFCLGNGLDSRQVIEAIGLDSRIGNHYNNPSFGYGGYCLPKDSRQLLASYLTVPQDLIGAIVESNITRKHFIASTILSRAPKVVGVHRLCMKAMSDNFRHSSVLDVIDLLKAQNIDILIYEPLLEQFEIDDTERVDDLEEFKSRCDLILANRRSCDLADVEHKIFSRDLFGSD